MRNPVPARIALALGAAMLTAHPADAGETRQKNPNLSDTMVEATPAGQAVETLALAYRLADHARAAEDARAMLVAARMIASAPVASAPKAEAQGPEPTAQGLFEEASKLAAGDADLLAQIEAARVEQGKGIICGPRCGAIRTVQWVKAGTSWRVRFAARGGEPLVVGVRRDAATGMDLKVYDENGYLVCQDLSQATTLYCRVNPIWSGPFFAVVVNHGARGVGVAMVTN